MVSALLQAEGNDEKVDNIDTTSSIIHLKYSDGRYSDNHTCSDIRPNLENKTSNQLITTFSLFPEVIIDLEVNKKKGKVAENQLLWTWLALPVL